MDPYASYVKRIEAALSRALPDEVDPEWLKDVAGRPVPDVDTDWVDRFLEPGRILLGRGGKRWRPLVTLLTCEALGGGDAADLLAPLTEIPHNGSLIVDDIEDAAAERRGGPALHLLFGLDLAINAGNMMYYLPVFLVNRSKLSPGIREAILRDYEIVMRRLHLGQGFDILWHREKDLFPPVSAYLQMCRFKTGSLASLAAIVGARAAAASEDTAGALGAAWENLGTGFQILDDVKNLTTGNPGKHRGDDVVEGKKSLPVIYHASDRPDDREKLVRLFERAAVETPGGDWSAVEEAIGILTDSGAVAEAGRRGKEILEKGRKVLEEILPDGNGRHLSLGLVDAFIAKML